MPVHKLVSNLLQPNTMMQPIPRQSSAHRAKNRPMSTKTLSKPIRLGLLAGISTFLALASKALIAAPAPTGTSPQVRTQSPVTLFKRQQFPGGELFKTPKNPAGWNISIQRDASTSARDKKNLALVNIHVTTDKANSLQNYEFSDGNKTESWTWNGLRIVSSAASSRASISDSVDVTTEADALWELEAISGWTNMQELSWIKPEHFLASYQGQESRYHIFVEEHVLEEPPPAPSAPSTANRMKAPTPQPPEQKYPQGMIPGVPLKPMIRAALVDATTLLPKRVQLGLTTLIYTYDATPTHIVLPAKVVAILPAGDTPGTKTKNTNVSSIPVP
jgi:hypothetical protein